MNVKSEHTLEAANRLLSSYKDTYATQSVHCLYYSVLQFMEYILANAKSNSITYQQQCENGRDSSHKFVLEQIILRLDFNKSDKRQFYEDFHNLKRARIEADYYPNKFMLDQALDFKNMAERLLALLKNVSNDKINH